VEIDASGKYVMPGLINAHAHVQDERGGIPQPVEYELKLWLACGITTARDVGSDTPKTLKLRAQSAEGEVACPRLFVYPMFNQSPTPRNPDEARARVRQFKAMGVDGIKILGVYRDVMEALEDEAHKAGLRVAHHAGVEETNAWDDIKFGTTSIEHWYGIPDAAIESGRQNFPAAYNYNNETDRFRYAGHLWREANWDRLMKVFDAMVQANVAWDPTLDIYEAAICSAPRPSPGFTTTFIPPWPSISSRTQQIMGRTSSDGRRPTRRSGRKITVSRWRRYGNLKNAAA
jgi:hypothetical protein